MDEVRDFVSNFIDALSSDEIQSLTNLSQYPEVKHRIKQGNISDAHEEIEWRIEEVERGENKGAQDVAFLTDLAKLLPKLDKLYRLIEKKDLDTSSETLAKRVVQEANRSYHDDIIDALHPEITRLQNTLYSPSVDTLLKEYLASPLNRDQILNDANLAEKVLQAFNLERPHNLKAKLDSIQEQIELEQFEQRLEQGNFDDGFTLLELDNLTGEEFEEVLHDLFQALGYTVVQTTNGPDQGADLIVRHDNDTTAVQAKHHSNNVSNGAIQEIVAAKQHYNCDKALVVATTDFTTSAEELAMSNNVKLWNRERLEQKANQVQDDPLQTQQGSNIKQKGTDAYITTDCPFCGIEVILFQEDLPRKGETKRKDCPSCGVELTLDLPPDQYDCKGCGKSFQDAIVRNEHEEACDSYQERSYYCEDCGREFILNDEELCDLRENGHVEITCPECGAANQV